MTTYKKSGVDVSLGDTCSRIAYSHAKKTFPGRKGKIGMPVTLEGGFSGALDMGDFYLVQNSDGVGSKIEIARSLRKYDTLGYDLLAMVADDAVCMGAEVISMVNTIDTEKTDAKVTDELMKGLAAACKEQEIVIAGGEIAEVPTLVRGITWNASAIGIVEKSKLITGADIRKNDVIVGLLSRGFRSNGFSLVRHILHNEFGNDWYEKPFGESLKSKEVDSLRKNMYSGKTWGEVTLTPSIVYHRCVLDMIGGFKKKRVVDIHGIAHITGGGLYGNTQRILPKGRKAIFNKLPEPHLSMLKLMKMGNVSRNEAYKTWNMGIGMVLICPEREVEKIRKIAEKNNIRSVRVGHIS